MLALADNTFILTTPDKRQLVFLERSSGTIRGLLIDDAGNVIQASQLSALKLWLHLRDDTTLPVGGINNVSDTNVLNDGVRGVIGNNKTITDATSNLTEDDYRGRIRLTIASHAYNDGDLIGVRGVRGLRGANGDWGVLVIDPNIIELIGSSGSGTYTSGGTATKGLHLQLQSSDNAIVQSPPPAIGQTEWHEAYLLATFSGKQAPFLVHVQVKNLGKAS
jgi:hypothetical protein